jgi:hypothetical protein
MAERGVGPIFVLMRSDKERREASVGPPQILSAAPPDDDEGEIYGLRSYGVQQPLLAGCAMQWSFIVL